MKVQDNLLKLGEWSNDVNMAFNYLKFECLKTGIQDDLKIQYNYLTPNLEHIIEVKDHVKDLGTWMSSNGNFDYHISKVICKVIQRIGWIRRSFMTNTISFKRFMWKNYIGGILDYNSQLWSPVNTTKISALIPMD